MLGRLRARLAAPPADYRAGQVLMRLAAEFADFEHHALSATSARFRAREGSLLFDAHERVEPQFLMHTVTVELVFPLRDGAPGSARIGVRHRGAFVRKGIELVGSEALPALAARLLGDSALRDALMPLDFTKCELVQDASGWRVHIVPYGASEVASRFPPYRRYIRLPVAQRRAMLDAFRAFERLLAADCA